MKNRLVVLLTILSASVFAQSDSAFFLRIIGDKVVMNKQKLLLNFSYYFENHTKDNVVVLDYYDQCHWEEVERDTSKSHFVVLVIKDDSGNIVLPSPQIDTGTVSGLAEAKMDSTRFYEKYEKLQKYDFDFHTRVIHPGNVLIDLFTMRLNKRKCFKAGKFNFDFNRKYTCSLFYLAKDDIHQVLNRSVVRPEHQVFLGRLESNVVEITFK